MSRVVVTGGAGFIGSHLTQSLLEDGYEVVVVDNMITGQKTNLRDVLSHKHLSLRQHNIVKPFTIEEEIDWVLHLASIASPKYYRQYPIKTLQVGAHGTYNTLELARKHEAQYLFTSSSEVYGDPEVNPQPESYRGKVDPVGPRACYDESKRYSEALITAYHEKYGIDVRIPRIFNTYGSHMRINDGRVIPNFITQALTGKALTVYGDGSQTRSFCYIDDMVTGLRKLMETKITDPINLGHPHEITIQHLAETILDLVNTKSGITYESLPPQDPKVRHPDISKAKQQLNWKPTTSLQKGLQATILWFKQKNW